MNFGTEQLSAVKSTRLSISSKAKGLVVILASLLIMSLSACSKSSGGKDGELGEETIGGINDSSITSEEGRFNGGNIPNASESSRFPDVRFEYDSSTVRQSDYEVVRETAKVVSQDPTLHVELEGHCDRRGTAEYNLALGEERAKAVAALMVSFGANANQLSTISYGEEIPLDPSDSDSAYEKNRRVHFAVYRKGAGR